MDLYGREAVFKMKKRKGLLPGWLVPLAFVALCGYLFFLLIQYQVSIASKQQELQSLQDQLTAQETTNAELSSTLDRATAPLLSATPASRAMCARTSACLWTSAANNFVLAGALCGNPSEYSV